MPMFCIRSSSVSLRAETMPEDVKVLMKSLPTDSRRTAFSLATFPERKCIRKRPLELCARRADCFDVSVR